MRHTARLALAGLLLLNAGCTRARRYPAGSGGVSFRGLTARYNYENYRIRHVIIYNRAELLHGGSATSGGRQHRGQLQGGGSVDFEYVDNDTVRFGADRYELGEGCVFLCEIGEESNTVVQLPHSFQRRGSPTADISGHVLSELERLAEREPRLVEFAVAHSRGE
jgi:hypothetical protein